jgi:hypothetical protein
MRRHDCKHRNDSSPNLHHAMLPRSYLHRLRDQDLQCIKPGYQDLHCIKPGYQDLHCIKSDYIDPNIHVKLYDYIKIRQDHRRVLHRQ